VSILNAETPPPRVLPKQPTIGDLVGDGDTTPPDLPPDPLDPGAPTNAPPPAADEAEPTPTGPISPLTESEPADQEDGDDDPGVQVGPAKVTLEDAGKDGITVGVSFDTPGS
jgi:hypothetical protein